MSSGKSKSNINKNGVRRMVNNKKLSPRSIRKFKYFLDDCTDEQLNKAKIERD